MRKKMVAGNWKMNKSPSETIELLEKLTPTIVSKEVDVVICPPFLSIPAALDTVKGEIHIGAQNVHEEDKGAYTGEISASMLKDLDISYVIIGHSERREIYKETDTLINKKMKQAISHNMKPILCVGENLLEREENITLDIIKNQVENALKDISHSDMENVIIAYEPIWAIGTGKTATAKEAEEVCKSIRELLENIYDTKVSKETRILYGGSVNKENAKELFSMENIDGGLVGGASLTEEFSKVVHYNN